MNTIVLSNPFYFPEARIRPRPGVRAALAAAASHLGARWLQARAFCARLADHPAAAPVAWVALALAVIGAQVEWTQARFAR